MTVTVPTGVEPAGISAAKHSAVLATPAIAAYKEEVTMAELSAGINISCVLYQLAATGTQTKTERRRHCYGAPKEDLGREQWTIDDIEYDWDPQNPDATEGDYAHYSALEPGSRQFIVERLGLEFDEDWEVGQWVRIIPVKFGVRAPVTIDIGNEGQTLSVRQTVAVTGEPSYVQIAA